MAKAVAGRPGRPVDQAAAVQGIVEGADVSIETVEFMGQSFRVAEKVGLWPMLQFAAAAKRGIDSEDSDGMAAMYALIRDCIYTGTPACGKCEHCKPDEGVPRPDRCPHYERGDFDRFEHVAIESKAGDEDLLGVVQDVMEMISARPTTPRSGSSPPEPSRSARSRARSSAPARIPPGADGLVPVSAIAR